MKVKTNNANEPIWSEVTVKNHIPAELKKLDELAHNLWWSWNPECVNLFRCLDKDQGRWKEPYRTTLYAWLRQAE